MIKVLEFKKLAYAPIDYVFNSNICQLTKEKKLTQLIKTDLIKNAIQNNELEIFDFTTIFSYFLFSLRIEGQERKLTGSSWFEIFNFIIHIQKQHTQLQVSGISMDNINECQVFGKLLEDKLYQHHAIQDSIEVDQQEINSFVDQQINAIANQIGSMEKLLDYYKKDSEQDLNRK